MNNSELRDLVERIIAEMIPADKPLPRPLPEANTAVVLLSGASISFDEAIAQMRTISDAGVRLDFVQTRSAERVLDQEVVRSLGMTPRADSPVGNHSMLIVPMMTVNLAAKVACGIAEDEATNLFAQFIQSGRPIVAVRDACCPDSAGRRSIYPQIPEGYRRRLIDNLKALDSYGVHLVNADQLAQTVLELI